MKKLRIVFMGTPEFAVGILDAICKKGYDVVGVITAADKPAGRGQKMTVSAVKTYCIANNLTVLQPTNLKDDGFLQDLKALQANLQVVVAFRMLPEAVWRMPKLGTFNLHASLLPNYRGAAPINWAIVNGESKTGVTTFFIDDKIDTGAMILQSEVDIEPDENAGSLHDKLQILGSKTVLETLQKIESDTVFLTQQSDMQQYKLAPKLSKENCKIDFSKQGIEIQSHIRGLSPYPGAWCTFEDEKESYFVKIFSSSFKKEGHNLEIGSIICSKKELQIAVQDGYVVVLDLQFPGKRRMKIFELLNGMTFSNKLKAL